MLISISSQKFENDKKMTIENYPISQMISLNEGSCASTNHILSNFRTHNLGNVFSGEPLEFDLLNRTNKLKISPILSLAREEEANELIKIYRDLYNGSYPYREMLDELEVKKMIVDPSIRWITFKDKLGNITGCVTFVLDFINKRGYIRGFMLKKKYQRHIDIIKAMIGSLVGMCFNFKDKILSWYVENRTAHTGSQYPMYRCGMGPIGFYPNKDVFFGEVESDLMQIIYDVKALNGIRSKEYPQIIPEATGCFNYSNEKYNLGPVKIKAPKLKLDKKYVDKLQYKLDKEITIDKFGYHNIMLYISGTESYFKFLYTPQVQNFEKTQYCVNNLEELYVFVQEFKNLAQLLKVRYCEAFVSAYDASHQTIFQNAGLSPRGYIPSWKFNQKKNRLEDFILFNSFEGKISKNIQLIDEGKKLLNYLNFD